MSARVVGARPALALLFSVVAGCSGEQEESGRADMDLARGGAVSAQVLVDDGLPVARLRVGLRLVRNGGSLLSLLVPASGESRYTWTGLTTGSTSLVIFTDVDPEPLVEIEDIQVVEGELTIDPRLDAIDLRGRLKSFVVDVAGPGGGRLGRTEVNLHAPVRLNPGQRDVARNFSQYGWHLTDSEKGWEILTARDSVDLYVTASGYRSVHLAGVSEDQQVVLRPGLPVRLVVSGVELPSESSCLLAQLYPVEEELPWGPWDWKDLELDTFRETELGVEVLRADDAVFRATSRSS